MHAFLLFSCTTGAVCGAGAHDEDGVCVADGDTAPAADPGGDAQFFDIVYPGALTTWAGP
jgi:hypothetical protein